MFAKCSEGLSNGHCTHTHRLAMMDFHLS